MLAHPLQLGRGKAGEHDIAGQGAKLRVTVQCRRLCMAAGVVPQDAGAHHSVGAVQHGGTVHVARQADAADLAEARALQPRHHRLGCGQPVGGGLLAPALMGALHGQGGGCLCHHLLRIVDQNGLQPRRSQIKPDIHPAASAGTLPLVIGQSDGHHRPVRQCHRRPDRRLATPLPYRTPLPPCEYRGQPESPCSFCGTGETAAHRHPTLAGA